MAYKEFGATIAPANTSETGFPNNHVTTLQAVELLPT